MDSENCVVKYLNLTDNLHSLLLAKFQRLILHKHSARPINVL